MSQLFFLFGAFLNVIDKEQCRSYDWRHMDAAIQLLRRWRGDRSCLVAARELDCDPSYLSLLERGKRKPRQYWRDVIERVVGIPAHLWDETVAHQGTLDRVSPNVNDTQPKSLASLTPLPKPAAKRQIPSMRPPAPPLRKRPPNKRQGLAS